MKDLSVVVYTMKGCPFCVEFKEMLTNEGIEFFDRDIDDYKDDGIDKIIETRCVMCHNKEASGLPNFSSFEGIKPYTTQDTGATFASLTRISHIHLFGISFIFMFVGLIFSFAETTTTQRR